MSTSATGTVVDENGAGLPRLGVTLENIDRHFDVLLARATTEDNGTFALEYGADFASSDEPGHQVRQLRLRIKLGQHILHEIIQADLPTADVLAFPSIQLMRGEAESEWATLGTGVPSRMTAGNALQWLVDDEDAWGRVADLITAAKTIDVMQLQIDVDTFNPNDETKEKPKILLRFDPAKPLTWQTRRDIDAADARIERLLFKAMKDGHMVRIQVPRMAMDVHAGVTLGSMILGVAALMLLGGVIAIIAGIVAGVAAAAGAIGLILAHHSFSTMFGTPKLAQWFKAADASLGLSTPRVRVSELKMRSLMVTHSKMVIDRGVQGILLGSPFEQDYFDAKTHLIDEPRRGDSASKGPIHDVSVGLRGPIVGHMQELFNAHWNLAEADDQQQTPANPPPLQSAESTEFLTSVQLVRTLDQMLGHDDKGEAGVREAYLRAIHFAERFIYIENQYFNVDCITDALIEALRAKPALVLIMLLNVIPDMPLYLRWQGQAIDKIVGSFGDVNTARSRVGVFSTFSHAPSDPDNTKPRLVDNYLHTKSALIDNRWATVGSANLDGASIDSLQYGRPLLGGDVRNSEANVVVIEDGSTQRSAVDALRRRLWSEHLGIADPGAAELDDAQGKNWLEVWRQKAQSKLTALQNNLDTVSTVRIVEWKSTSYISKLGFKDHYRSHAGARMFLEYLFSPDDDPSEVLVSQYKVLGAEGPPSFIFKQS